MPKPDRATIGRRTLLSSAAAMLIGATMISPSGVRSATAAPVVGAPAPAFTGTDTAGRTVSLADYRGKVVVLEWTNHDCPFVVRHYSAGAMQALQRQSATDGVVWLTVVSSAPGEQGHVSPAEADQLTRNRDAAPAAVLLDPTGAIGRAYAAKTTPHMFVIDRAGALVYAGAIDDQPRNAGADPARANNHVRAALADVAAGRPVATAVTQPYGCSIKYVP